MPSSESTRDFNIVGIENRGRLRSLTSLELSLDLLSYLFYIAEEMKRGELLGSLEHIILLALARLDGSAHGMIVRREIEERIGRNISIGAVYATLERLEAKGYVSSFTGEPTRSTLTDPPP